jgi:hypothetical protein
LIADNLINECTRDQASACGNLLIWWMVGEQSSFVTETFSAQGRTVTAQNTSVVEKKT